MIEQGVRSYYEKVFIDPVLKRLSAKVSPNLVTSMAGVFGVLIFPALVTGHVWLSILLLALSGYCDVLDGSLARLRNCTSSWGTVLDIVMDRVVEISTIMALWAVDSAGRSLSCLCMLACITLCITSFLVVGIFSDQQTDKSFDYSPGLMERAEAFLFFAFMMIIPNWFIQLSIAFCLLVLYTAVVRLWQFRCQIDASTSVGDDTGV